VRNGKASQSEPRVPSPEPRHRPMSLVALTRPVPDSIADCELTHLSRVPIDVATARAQHAAYEVALGELGCEVRHVPAAHEHPDSLFIEDVAVVLDEIA